ncbi:hypothetical protein D3C72_1872100 [compost metagenome]
MTVEYTDASGAQVVKIVDNEMLEIKSYIFIPIFINVKSNTEISVNVISDMTNIVFVSANIKKEG